MKVKAKIKEQAQSEFHAWFEQQGWSVFPFQKEAWNSYLAGRSGLISVPTGSGKTYAAIGGPFIEWLRNPQDGLFLIYVSPLRALARDLVKAIERPIREINLKMDVGLRSSDATAKSRAKMKLKLPSILVITPESLELLMTEPRWPEHGKNLRAIVVDEWHELLGTKRGSMLELSLARVRHLCPQVKTWVVSATIGNLSEAAKAAMGPNKTPVLVAPKSESVKPVQIRTILPATSSAFQYLGRSGIRMIDRVIDSIQLDESTLIFTNTRSQAEQWFRTLLEKKPEWENLLALHHGSLSLSERERVESAVKIGELKIVVATSSLDLGVDFPSVKRVIQIGSVKSFVRAIQRAGRAFHSPGQTTTLDLLPTQMIEIFEAEALREGFKNTTEVDESLVEARHPISQPKDVLVQFILNSAFNEGFDPEELYQIIRSAHSFADVSEDTYTWALDFVTSGGYSLSAYSQFRKLIWKEERLVFSDRRASLQHKINLGTIVSGTGVQVKFARGASLGTVDEGFITRLKPGSVFYFSGKNLKLIQLRDMTAFVRLAPPAKKRGDVNLPVWTGTSLPMSSQLSQHLRRELAQQNNTSPKSSPEAFQEASPEAHALEPLIAAQKRISKVPKADEILIELSQSSDGYHLFVFAFEGRLVHEGIGHLLAYRLSQLKRNTFAISANDYGFELMSTEAPGSNQEIQNALQDSENLEADIEKSLNYPELAKSAFREIARVSGMIFQGFPGSKKTTRHLQMSSSLLFDVFQKYEPKHPLLLQAYNDVRQNQLQIDRLIKTMKRFQSSTWLFQQTPHISPLAWPLYIDRMRSSLTNEKLEDRIARLQKKWELAP